MSFRAGLSLLGAFAGALLLLQACHVIEAWRSDSPKVVDSLEDDLPTVELRQRPTEAPAAEVTP